MPIKRVGKFLETEDLGIAYSLGIESAQIDECVCEINRRNIEGVFGCPVFGFNEDNFDFFTKLKGVRQVWFWDISLKDISGLYAQSGLEYFGVSTKRPAINFSCFKELHTVAWEPVKKDTGIADLPKLRNLDIWRYKSKDLTFHDLSLPKSIRKLEINWCSQDSIESLPHLPELDELQIHYCRNLKSLSGLTKVAPNLRKLVITRCANLENIEEVAGMKLDHVYINVKGKELANIR